MRIVAVITTCIAVMLYSLLIIILAWYGRKKEQRLLFLFLSGLAVWQAVAFCITVTDSESVAGVLYHISFFAHSAAFAFSLPFVLSFTGRKGLGPSLAAAGLVTLLPSIRFLTDVPLILFPGNSGFFVPEIDVVSIFTSIPAFLMYILSTVFLLLHMRTVPSLTERSQTRLFFLSFLFNIAGTISNTSFLQDFPVDIFFQIIGAVIISYVFLSYHFVSLRRFVESLVQFLFHFLSAVTIFLVLLLFFQSLINRSVKTAVLFPSLAAFASLLVFVYFFQKKRMNRPPGFFFTDLNNRYSLLEKFSEEAIRYHTSDTAITLILDTSFPLFSTDQAVLVFLSGSRHTLASIYTQDFDSDGVSSATTPLKDRDSDFLFSCESPLWSETRNGSLLLNILRSIDTQHFDKGSYLISPVIVKEDRPVFLILSTRNRKSLLTDQDYTILRTFCHVCSSLIHRIHILEKLEQSLSEKEILLREVHHRVKNNFQVINSLLNMQIQSTQFEEVKTALSDSRNRLDSMASVHDYLYRSENFTEIVLSDYADRLLSQLKKEYSDTKKTIEVHLFCDDIRLPLEKAISIGLILNELITNSFKYAACLKNHLVLDINISRDSGNMMLMSVRDNGHQAYAPESALTNGFGWDLVKILAESDLGGSWSVNTDNGTHHLITFPCSVPAISSTHI